MTFRLGNLNSTDVVMGDLDGDGDLDAFVTNYYNQPNKVWLNNGNGTFTQGQSVGNSTSKRLAVGDLDGDCRRKARLVKPCQASCIELTLS